jgi:hypothetical protein
MHTFIQYSIILISLFFWFYIDNKKIFEKNIKNSSLIHAIICSIGIHIGYFCNPLIIYNYIIVPELYDIYIIVPLITFGYSLYDLYIGIKSQKPDELIHGILFVTCNFHSFFNDNILLSYTFLITETSTIFLNLRVYRDHRIDVLFALTFFIYRIMAAPILSIIYLSDVNNEGWLFGCITGTCVTILNLYWFRLIVKKALKKENSE